MVTMGTLLMLPAPALPLLCAAKVDAAPVLLPVSAVSVVVGTTVMVPVVPARNVAARTKQAKSVRPMVDKLDLETGRPSAARWFCSRQPEANSAGVYGRGRQSRPRPNP